MVSTASSLKSGNLRLGLVLTSTHTATYATASPYGRGDRSCATTPPLTCPPTLTRLMREHSRSRWMIFLMKLLRTYSPAGSAGLTCSTIQHGNCWSLVNPDGPVSRLCAIGSTIMSVTRWAPVRPSQPPTTSGSRAPACVATSPQLGITLCRALNVPARYISGYLPDIAVIPPDLPMDFCSWFEAWLDGRWWTFDPRNNQRRSGRVVIARGRDALDAAMVTTWGAAELKLMNVWADEVSGCWLRLSQERKISTYWSRNSTTPMLARFEGSATDSWLCRKRFTAASIGSITGSLCQGSVHA